MTNRSGALLRKITLNLYDDDVATIQKFHGHGYTEAIRDWVHTMAEEIRGKRRAS